MELKAPPSLKTSNTFDDDESFTNVALNLMSRFQALGLTEKETLIATLTLPSERFSFLKALHSRKAQSSLSSSVEYLVKAVDKNLGKELLRLVCEEDNSADYEAFGFSPRSYSKCCRFGESQASQRMSSKRVVRRFFPDCESIPFFRSTKIRNIDWKLAEAVDQVQCLKLDGASTPRSQCNGNYVPPSPMTRLAH